MSTLADKTILFAGCALLLCYPISDLGVLQVLSFLCTIIFICIMSCCNLVLSPIQKLPKLCRRLCCCLCLIFALHTSILPSLCYFLPLLSYELITLLPANLYPSPITTSLKQKTHGRTCLSDLKQTYSYNKWSLWLLLFLVTIVGFQTYQSPSPLLLCLLHMLAIFLSLKSQRLLQMENSLHLLRDTSIENHTLLRQKNQNLIRQQNYEIHVATLRERNRIAREIHDNVGHMLSRSILQSGALIAINQQETLREPLDALKQTLSSAMDSIRESVHDLRDDSIDLESSIQELLSEFSGYQISFDYDMNTATPVSIKYCFLSIVKEALSNIARHSNATDISITLREHPLLYQLVVYDNGTCQNKHSYVTSGMGISNMEERVKQLNGNFAINSDHGFRIFVSIPRSC